MSKIHPSDEDSPLEEPGGDDSNDQDPGLSSLSLSAALDPALAVGLGIFGSDETTQELVSPKNNAVDADRAIDDSLIDRTLAGDSAAFGELADRYQDRLRNTLLRMTGSAEEAEDVAQEAFVQAYLKLDSFQRSARFYTWLYRIAFNQAISKNRKRRPRVSLNVVQEAGGPEPVSEAIAPTDPVLTDERSQLLHAAIAELAEDHRQVLVLREFEDFDYQQIAEILDIPIGTVRSRLFRARTQLRDRLAPVLGEQSE